MLAGYDRQRAKISDRKVTHQSVTQGCVSERHSCHAARVVFLGDRLLHRAEVIEIDAESYRLEEAKELNAARVKQRRSKAH